MQVYRSVDVELMPMTPDAFVKYLGTWYGDPICLLSLRYRVDDNRMQAPFCILSSALRDEKGRYVQWAPTRARLAV